MNKTTLIIIAALILIQFIPLDRDNPPAADGAEIILPADIEKIIKNSCYDCHSNNTVWPWYSNVAPVSWLVVYNVQQAREELNFSEWNSYSEKRMNYKLKELVEEIEEDEMPLSSYLLLHGDAQLSEGQKEMLMNWAKLYNKVTIDSTTRVN